MTPVWAKACTPEANAKKGLRGERNPHWKPIGARSLSHHGYVKVKVAAGEWEYEHRIVAGTGAEQVTHHKNRDKTDNRPENLEVMTNEEHIALHAKEDR
jgi:HNH endonuclease